MARVEKQVPWISLSVCNPFDADKEILVKPSGNTARTCQKQSVWWMDDDDEDDDYDDDDDEEEEEEDEVYE